MKLVDWIVSDVNPYSSGANPTGEIKGLFDPDAHAEKVIRALESRCKAIGVDHSLFPAVALQVANRLHSGHAATKCPPPGRGPPDRRVSLCLRQETGAKNPREPAFHLLLAQAFEQESKNAWQVFDYTAIKDALRKALGEARIGLRLDPGTSMREQSLRVSRKSWSMCPPNKLPRDEPATPTNDGIDPVPATIRTADPTNYKLAP